MSNYSTPGADNRLGAAAYGAAGGNTAPGGPAAGHTPPDPDREPLRAPFPRPGFAGRRNPKERVSLGTLLADTPRLFVQLAKDELERAKRELTAKGKKLVTGAALLAAAAFFALTMWAVLVTAAILGLNEAFAPWLSALIVAGVFLIFVLGLVLFGVLAIKRSLPLTPEETLDSVKRDVNAVKGLGRYE
ncbi:hypothetical protein GCM10011490_18620 [Pseudoclavibacter endophyticus]|uniref:Phage holin family protein n=1 Tax=Pseudoclavibacter endophyticus TaxID=1778590 RepID=A0A6H9WL76_9MICO|nr:phage holin family protein [Pseudoclavibacter endophyticus]KAB1648798.1 phage holin family protein [Pseudoclavibacter endophyticus]GGA68442.1 hypothetical protein GCM10011490_18620 [Pseudoclavibacter endophyticus]